MVLRYPGPDIGKKRERKKRREGEREVSPLATCQKKHIK